jgi:hypothetical protein
MDHDLARREGNRSDAVGQARAAEVAAIAAAEAAAGPSASGIESVTA